MSVMSDRMKRFGWSPDRTASRRARSNACGPEGLLLRAHGDAADTSLGACFEACLDWPNSREEPMRIMRLAATLLAVSLLASPHAARADDYPNHPITLIVPYPPGGGVDTIARVIGGKLTDRLGQQVVIENRPGAGAVIGTRAAAKAAPDGYTLVMLATGFTLPANTGYEASDFVPIGSISSTPIVVMAHPSAPVKSLSDLVALAKKDPGKLAIGTPPPPTLNYFAIELMKVMTGIDVTIVTYKGTGPLTNDLVGGHVPLAFNTTAPALGNIQAGKIRPIAGAAPKRSARLPNVPTAAEAGFPGLEGGVAFWGAPPGRA